MRLHRLAITAFGPFAGSEEVDLDALSSSGLFLIHGPTGAGKTSILDAICFALYAAVPGSRNGARASLRSDHAVEGVVPEVTLELTVSGRRLRVCRSPEFSRPKKRGIGRTTVPAKVVLEELVGTRWSNLGTRHDEVAMVLKDLLGMGLEQFIKVVLLPQGDFAAFLRASPEERRSVLEKLFDTRRFTDVETWLAERRRQTSAALGAARERLSTGLLRVDDVLARLDEGDDVIAPGWSELLHPEVSSLLASLVRAVDQRASDALAAVEVAESLVAKTQTAVHRGTVVHGHQKTAALAQSRLAVLDEQQELFQEASRSIERSERAAAVSGFVAGVNSADVTCDAALVQVRQLCEPLSLLVESDADIKAGITANITTDITTGITAVGTLIDQVAAQGDALQQVFVQDGQARQLADESARHSQAAAVNDSECAAVAHERDEATMRLADAERSRDAGRAGLAQIPALEARQKTLVRIRQLLKEQEQSAASLQTLAGQADSAAALLLDRRGRLLDLRERRLAGLAAELANGLRAGEPCPVCGSGIHPATARTTDLVSATDIQSAETEQTLATEDLSQIRSSVSAELARRDARAVELLSHSADLGGSGQPEGSAGEPVMAATDLADALAAGADLLADARAAAAALPEANAQLAALLLEVEHMNALFARTVAARASCLALAASTHGQSVTAAAEVATLLAHHREACPCRPTGLTALTEVAEVISWHRQTLDHLRALATGLGELSGQRANASAAARRLSTALQANGLESMEQAQSFALSTARFAELTALVRSAEQQRAEATALLGQGDVTAALSVPAPDLDALVQAHRQAAGLLTDAGRRHTLSEQAQRELSSLSAKVHQALADLGPAQEESVLVQELAECLAGNSADNALRMRLSSFVLAARLAEIAVLANERLTVMSDGRYALEYTEARAAKGARSGLGLLVRDAWNGQSRETSSLSGGEAFMASLALALGLGDAVRAESGGFDLQTLFVDEGFGSLDEESIEQVMAVLDTLRDGGRAVGIVSHVSELRARIPHQLHVLKQQSGSRIQTENRQSPAA